MPELSGHCWAGPLTHTEVHPTVLQGYPPLTKILAHFFGKLLGQDIDPQSNVLVTVGAYGALFSTFQALVDEGDEVSGLGGQHGGLP